MRKVMPSSTATGLDNLSRIAQEEGIRFNKQYFGLLMQNFEVKEEKFHTAIEVAAQNSLFHVIVDTDTTAAQLVKRLEHDKLGRVTFLPLNQLQVEDIVYPDSPDIAPLLSSCINFDSKVERAMKHVFGKKLLAR